MLNLLLRHQAPDDVFKFGEYVFGVKPAAHHREMVEFILDCLDRKEHGVCLEPRGFAKSTWVTRILASYLVAKNPDIRIGLFSKTADHAADFSRGIRNTLEANDLFRDVFGHLVGEGKWTDKQWIRAGSKWAGSNYATVFTGGPGGQTASKRFDIILCDDIIDDENVQTVDQMEAIERWFWKTLYPCLAKDGVIIVLGTRWGEGDLYEQLFTDKPKGRGWRHLIRSALIEDENGLHSLWPEEFSVMRLLAMRDDMGSATFACSMLNDISGLMAGYIFRREWFQYFDVLPEGPFTYRMGVDLAMSTRERADYTARVVIAEDRQGNFYVLSVYRDKIESGHAEFVNAGYVAFPQISLIKVESVQAQSLLVQELMSDFPRLPVSPKKTDTDKTTRGRAVAARYEAHRVYHHVSLRDSDFERELLSFNKGHDDMVDALGFAMDLGGNDFSFGFVSSSDVKSRGQQPIDPQKIADAVRRQEPDLLKGEMDRVLAAHFNQFPIGKG